MIITSYLHNNNMLFCLILSPALYLYVYKHKDIGSGPPDLWFQQTTK